MNQTSTAAALARPTPRVDDLVRPPHSAVVAVGVLAVAGAVGLVSKEAPALAVGAAAVAAVGVAVVLVRPVTATLVVIAVAPAASGLRRGFPFPGLRLTEVLVLVVLGAVLLTGWNGWRPRWSALDWATLAYTVATVVFVSIAAWWSGSTVGAGTVFSLLLPVQFLVLARAVAVSLVTAPLRAVALRLVLRASAVVSVLVVLQYLDVGDVRTWMVTATGSDNLADVLRLGFNARATGPFGHWHVLAGYLLPVALLGVALLLDRTQRVMPHAEVAVHTALAVVATTLTFTFTAAFGIVVGALLIASRAGRLGPFLRMAMVALVVVGGLLGPSIGARVGEQFEARPGGDRSTFLPETVDYRLEVWQDQYLPAIAERPIIGYGPELPESITWIYTESMYLGLQLQGGLPLVAVYAVLVWAFLATMQPLARAPDATVRAPAAAVFATTVVLVPMQAIFPYLSSPGLPHVVWLLAGVALASRWSPVAGRGSAVRPARAVGAVAGSAP